VLEKSVCETDRRRYEPRRASAHRLLTAAGDACRAARWREINYSFVAIAAKYGTNSHNVSFKNAVWQTFSSAVLAKC